MQPCIARVVAADSAVKERSRIARGLRRRRTLGIEHGAAHAVPRQCACRRCAGEPRADDDGFTWHIDRCDPTRRSRRYEVRRVACQRDVALGARAAGRFDGEADAAQPVAHDARRAPGGRRGARHGQSRQRGKQTLRPHRRILRRRKAIEKKGIDLRDEFACEPGCIAQTEQQLHAVALEGQTVQIGCERRPGGDELLRQRGQGTGSERARKIVARRRMHLQRDEVQPLAALRIVAPRGPRGEEVVAQAETGLEDGEACATAPAFGQAVAGEEDGARLFERTFARVIEIVELPGARRVVREVDARRDDRFGLHIGREEVAQALAAARACSQRNNGACTASRLR